MKIVKPVEAFDKSAEIYQNKFMDVSLYGALLDLFCDGLVSDDARILDIACGPGNIIKYLLGKGPGYRILGTDLSPRMLDLARANNPAAEFLLLDCRDTGSLERRFDGVSCGFCLPYLTPDEVIGLLKDVAGLLNPGGMFYLSTMIEDDLSKSRYQVSGTGDRVWVNYHREEALLAGLREHHFDVMDVRHFTAPDKDGLLITDLALTAKFVPAY